MAISEADIKLLWGRAAGLCSKCRDDLTVILEKGANYNVGEMAHVIAKKPAGPRGTAQGGPDSYDNLILLCPTCHKHIDKAPTEYSEEQLKKWKADHESQIRKQGIGEKFESLLALKQAVSRLLAENRSIWQALGPKSNTAKSDPNSNLYTVWELKKTQTILPNNLRIINMIEANSGLLGMQEHKAFLQFKLHADAFERHQYERLDNYPTFPKSFEESFAP